MASSSSTSCNVSGSSNSSKSMKDPYPLWKFVVKGDRISGGGGNYNWKCNFCGEVKNGSYTRVKAHLLGEQRKGIQTCNKVKIDDLAKLRKFHRESKDYKKSLLPKVPPFSNELISSHTSTEATSVRLDSSDNVKKRKSNNTIFDAFNMKSRDHLDSEIARMFYTGGCLLILLETLTMLLQPIKATWKTKGVNIVSDGWSDPQRRPLINIMIASETGPMFMKAIDCSGEIKDKDFIATLLSEVIDEIGDQNVVQIIKDNASNCKATGELVEGRWDIMVQKVKDAIYKKEGKLDYEESTFFNVVKGILSSRWSKGSTLLHSLAHSLNPRFYTEEWLNEVPGRVAPNADNEIFTQRLQCFQKLFQSPDERFKINTEFAIFSQKSEGIFLNIDCMHDMVLMDAKNWWAVMVPKNKLTPKRAQDLVYIHNNLRLLSRRSEEYTKGRSKLWDVGGDEHDNLGEVGILEMTELSLDEPEMENMIFDDVLGDGEE
uniref:DUF659 domain-containing protein n=1 Tax=Chenopodium quinoa TaxID=63459 RepID=A0A803M3X6_CHEQI